MTAMASDNEQAEDKEECHHNLPALETSIADLQRWLPEGFLEKGSLMQQL
jgi:hypothetical protein